MVIVMPLFSEIKALFELCEKIRASPWLGQKYQRYKADQHFAIDKSWKERALLFGSVVVLVMLFTWYYAAPQNSEDASQATISVTSPANNVQPQPKWQIKAYSVLQEYFSFQLQRDPYPKPFTAFVSSSDGNKALVGEISQALTSACLMAKENFSKGEWKQASRECRSNNPSDDECNHQVFVENNRVMPMDCPNVFSDLNPNHDADFTYQLPPPPDSRVIIHHISNSGLENELYDLLRSAIPCLNLSRGTKIPAKIIKDSDPSTFYWIEIGNGNVFDGAECE